MRPTLHAVSLDGSTASQSAAPSPLAHGERRLGRSDDPLIALGRLLDAARKLGDAQALAVADESGLLVAGSGHFEACEELAAQAAANQPSNDTGAAGPSVRPLSVKGLRVLLCAEGADLERALAHAEQGTRRILGRRSALG